jgi:urea transporter
MQSNAGASNQETEVQEIRSWAGISAPSSSGSGLDSKTDELRSWQQSAPAAHSFVKDSGGVGDHDELRSWASFPTSTAERSLSDAPAAVAPQHRAPPQLAHQVQSSGQIVRRINTATASSDKSSPVPLQQKTSSKAVVTKSPPLRISPFRTLPKLGIAASRRGGIVSFIDACLRSFGQVFFQNSPVSGALFIIALLASSTPVMAAVAMLAVASANLFSIVFEYDAGLRSSGIWGYNASLVGCGLTVFMWNASDPSRTPADALSILWAVPFLSCICVMLTSAVASISVPNGITPLTFPFQLATWWWLLAAQKWTQIGGTYAPVPGIIDPIKADDLGLKSYTASSIVEAILSGVAQVFFVQEWWSGVIMLVGIFLCSPISSAWALLGSIISTLISLGFGQPRAFIFAGLCGFNATLTAIAVGGFFLVQSSVKVSIICIIAIVATTILASATSAALSPIGLPPLTWPFTFITWITILSCNSIPGIVSVLVPSLTTAEDHLERLQLSRFVTAQFGFLRQFIKTSVSSADEIQRIERTLLPVVMCSAAAVGDTYELQKVLGLGADVDSCDYDLRTAFHLACAEHQTETVQFLLSHNCKTSEQDRWGRTPLEDCIRSSMKTKANCESLISLILSHNGQLNDSAKRQMGPTMCELAFDGDVRVLRYFLMAGVPANAADYDGRTAAHIAAAGEKPGLDEIILSLLLQYGGSDVDAALDRYGNRPSDEAQRYNFVRGIGLLGGTGRDKPARALSEGVLAPPRATASSAVDGADARAPERRTAEDDHRVNVPLPQTQAMPNVVHGSASVAISDGSSNMIAAALEDMRSQGSKAKFLLPSLLCSAVSSGARAPGPHHWHTALLNALTSFFRRQHPGNSEHLRALWQFGYFRL